MSKKGTKGGSVEKECKGTAVVGAIAAAVLAALLSGCSFKVETGWHGRTGRDDRVQTQLVDSEGKWNEVEESRFKQAGGVDYGHRQP